MANRKRTGILVVVVLLLLGLSLPVSNLVVGQPHSTKFSAAAGDSIPTAVRGVLEGKCAHCHTDDAGVPFYANFPLAGPVIHQDIQRGLIYLDLPDCFSAGKGVMCEVALAQIEHVAEQRTMPPLPYVAMHWNSALTAQNREDLLNWVRQTRVKQYATAGLPESVQQQVLQPLPREHGQPLKRVVLGEKLFNDKRLSKDNTLACAGCHELTKGGTDQMPVAEGVGKAKGPINSPTVYNALYNVRQFWDGRAADLSEQAAGPVENPLEMGEKWDNVVDKLKKDEAFKAEFEKEYPAGLSKASVTDAIATFERTLITPNSRFDKFLRGDQSAMSAGEQEGYRLFLREGCATCHCGKAMGGQSFALMGREKDYFGPRGKPTDADLGRFGATKKESDKHKFKVPTLRNIELTFPYFHDASAKDLPSAVKVMARVQYGRELSAEQIDRIVDFLKTLTGEYQGKPLALAPAPAGK